MARVVFGPPERKADATQDVSITTVFSRGNSFPRFPAPANRDTWLRRSNSRENGLKKGLVGRGRKTRERKTARNGASLVARNSTRAFLEFTTARDYAGDTNFARTFPWKRPLPSSWVGIRVRKEYEKVKRRIFKRQATRERELPLNLRWAIQFPSCPKIICISQRQRKKMLQAIAENWYFENRS